MRSNDNRRLYDGLIVLAAVVVSLIYIAAAGGNFPLDDSWIHQTYGRNLALLGQWAFIPGVQSAASTSPLYTVVLSAGYKLGIDFHIWTHGLGIVALAIMVLLGSRLAAQVAPDRKVLPLVTGLALVFAWHLIWAAVSGMETMIFCAFTLLLIWLGWRELQPHRQTIGAVALHGVIFGVIAGLATLTRPEGVMLAGIIGLALVIVRPNMTWRSLIIFGGAAAICFVIVLIPYLVFNYHVTGGLLPNTAAAKRAESAPYLAMSYFWRVGNLLTPLAAGGQVLLVPGMIAFAALLPRVRASILHVILLVWPIALILLYAETLPLEIQHGRYVIPALPAAIIAGVVGTDWLLQRVRRSMIGRVLVRTLAASTALLFVAFTFVFGLQAYVQDVTIINQEMVTAALWIKNNVPANATVVTHDIGALGYFAPQPLLDIGGLITPAATAYMYDPDAMWKFIQDHNGMYLMALDTQIPGRNTHDPHLCQVFDTNGAAAQRAGSSNMVVYRLTWDGSCPAN
ncbi:MAG TPA: hypothetical protein VHD90_20925 [Phototrophicaceae bacterium]|nr:hypothetical protein [Phototrophicaceae bacterium]